MKTENSFKSLFKLFILAIILPAGISCGNDRNLVFKHEFLMDTVVEITIAGREREPAEKAIEKAFAEIRRIDGIAGPEKGKELLEVNKNAHRRPVAVSEELFFIVDKALQHSRLTNGAFDISVAPLLELWGFLGGNRKYSVPEPELLSKALRKVDYRNIVLNKDRKTIFFKRKGTEIILGGIAKGYAVGRAIEVLKNEGIRNAIVNAGGDVQVAGDKFGKPWSIGIMHPRKPRSMLTTMEFKKDRCIFTSGDYERYFFSDNRRYHHILDPSTGYPAGLECISVTIISNDPVDADALATSVFVLGAEKGMELVESLPGTEVIMVCDEEGEIEVKQSKGISGKYKFKQK